MTAPGLFTAPDSWNGGFYELAVELGPRSDQRLDAAVRATWCLPQLEGPFPRRDREPGEQSRIDAGLASLQRLGHLYGVASLPPRTCAPCGTVAVREDGGPDWLVFYLPMGGLEAAFPVGPYPFHAPDAGPRHRTWREPLDNWLADLGRVVFAAVSFRLAIIGHEVSGTEYADMLDVSGIPDDRAIGYLWPQQGKLAYYGTNRWL